MQLQIKKSKNYSIFSQFAGKQNVACKCEKYKKKPNPNSTLVDNVKIYVNH